MLPGEHEGRRGRQFFCLRFCAVAVLSAADPRGPFPIRDPHVRTRSDPNVVPDPHEEWRRIAPLPRPTVTLPILSPGDARGFTPAARGPLGEAPCGVSRVFNSSGEQHGSHTSHRLHGLRVGASRRRSHRFDEGACRAARGPVRARARAGTCKGRKPGRATGRASAIPAATRRCFRMTQTASGPGAHEEMHPIIL